MSETRCFIKGWRELCSSSSIVPSFPLHCNFLCFRNYLEDIFDMIKEFWTADSPLQSTIILLVEAIAVALQSEFKEGGGERIVQLVTVVDPHPDCIRIQWSPWIQIWIRNLDPNPGVRK
jgi:hypothetical protein